MGDLRLVFSPKSSSLSMHMIRIGVCFDDCFFLLEIEVFLLRELQPTLWEAMVRPARKVRIGNILLFNDREFYISSPIVAIY